VSPLGDLYEHRHGVWWYKAPVPRRLHRCTPWTSGWINGYWIDRCACGSVRRDDGPWLERNSRERTYNDESTRTRWAWRVVAFVMLVALVWVAFNSDKKAEPDTRIDPCTLVLTQSGHRCQ
jgi:hypothetical protein